MLLLSARCLLEALGTKSVQDSDGCFWQGNFYLGTLMFRDGTTVLNERKDLKMVIWSVPDSVSLVLDLTN